MNLTIFLPRCRHLFLCILFFVYISSPNLVQGQQRDSAKIVPLRFSVMSSITNNGISIIPSFSLGKPAGVVEMSFGRRFTFDPQYRFSLSGEPWSTVFWFRYKVYESKSFRFSAGAHPAIMFNKTSDPNRSPPVSFGAKRFIAMELSPFWRIRPHTGLGIYYLQSRGLKETGGFVSHFLTINAKISSLSLSRNIKMNADPQIFLLQLNRQTGYFAAVALTLSHKKFPFSLQTLHNFRLQGHVPGAQPHVWNVSLIHSFIKTFER